MWEEGYASKELNQRSAQLQEKKDELERRKRKISNMKRSAKRGSGAGGAAGPGDSVEEDTGHGSLLSDSSAVDLDLAAEDAAVKYHLEQIKRYGCGVV